MRNKTIQSLAFALLSFACLSQVPTEGYFSNIQQVSAPEASSLFKFNETPVSYYTGVPAVNIPIYTISTDGLEIPISLSYHAGGHRVNDEADWLGLGWTLTGGGEIKITPSGKYDGGSLGYHGNDQLINDIDNFDNLNDIDRDGIATMISNNFYDLEPDVCSFSFPGYSGRFYEDVNGDITLIDVGDVEIENTSYGYSIHRTDGTVYEYDNTDNLHHAFDLNLGNGINGSTYYLSEILSKNGQSIRYTYGDQYTIDQQTESESKTVTLNNYSPQLSGTVATSSNFDSYLTKVGKRKITQIDFPQGLLFFNTVSDLSLFNDSKVTDHEIIVLKDIDHNIIKTWHLGIGVYDASNNCERKKLLYVIEESTDGTTRSPYALEYNTDYSLPCAGSFDKDYWGYYNSNSASTLVPTKEYSAGIIPGANRSTDAQKVKASIIKSITYPTGGRTEFTFEANTYSVDEYQLVPSSLSTGNLTKVTASSPAFTFNFTIDYDQWVEVDVSSSTTIPDPAFANVEIQPSSGTDISVNMSLNDQYFYLSAGSYTLFVDPDYFTSTSVNLYYKTHGSYIKNKNAGGVRIQKITSIDPNTNQPSMVRKFEYSDELESDRTSGVLLNSLDNDYYFYTTRAWVSSALNLTESMIVSSAGAVSAGASSVGYSRVKEIQGENGENGYIVYEFDMAPNVATPSWLRPSNNSHLNGHLKSKMIYDSSNNLKMEESHTYNTHSYGSISGMKARESASSYSDGGFIYEPPIVKASTFKVQFDRKYRTSSTTKTYSDDGTLALANTINYSHGLLPDFGFTTSSSTVESKGQTVVSYTYYPDDFSAGANHWTTDIRDNSKHQQLPILQLQKKNGEYVSGSFTEYTFSNGQVLPYKIYVLEPDGLTSDPASGILSSGQPSSDFTLRATFMQFDDKGNPLEVYVENDTHTSYLWDDNKSLPLAKIENAEYAEVAFTSFEENALGKFTRAGSLDNSDAQSGAQSYDLSTGNISLSSLSTAQTYVITYWTKGAVSINGSTATQYKTNAQGWNYYEIELSNINSLTVSGSGLIDDLSIYPADARISTYTYKPLVGVSSMSDTQGETQYFEYDSFGRLKYVKDADGNILSQNEYNYKP